VADLGRGVSAASRNAIVGLRAAVIGGGWAGMAAAAELAARGVRVAVFEAARTLGGRARRVTLEGIELDNGQHILIGAYRETLAAMRRVGADPRRLLARLPLELRFADGFHLRPVRAPWPLGLALALARAAGPADAWRALRFLGAARARGFRVAPDRPVAQWLAEHGQSGRLRKYLWEPLCVSALNTPAALASAQVFANVLREALTGARDASDLLLPRADLSRLFPEPAAEFVRARGGQIFAGRAVRAIHGAPGRFALDDHPGEFSHVVVACAPQHALALVPRWNGLERVRAAIERLDYQPIVTCYLQYPPSVALSAPMLGFAGGRVQWLFDRGKLGGPAGLLAAVISGSGPHAELESGALAAAVEGELAASWGRLPATLWSRTIAERRATFSCEPSLERPETTTPVPGLLLAGDYVGRELPGTLESAVRSGGAAAREIAGAA
jgi:hydroxysqualene dehydroxylase